MTTMSTQWYIDRARERLDELEKRERAAKLEHACLTSELSEIKESKATIERRIQRLLEEQERLLEEH